MMNLDKNGLLCIFVFGLIIMRAQEQPRYTFLNTAPVEVTL